LLTISQQKPQELEQRCVSQARKQFHGTAVPGFRLLQERPHPHDDALQFQLRVVQPSRRSTFNIDEIKDELQSMSGIKYAGLTIVRQSNGIL
jgi:hypothetical protein